MMRVGGKDLFDEIVGLILTHHQGIFDVYLGLTASGYDLGNPIRASKIREGIKAGKWGQQTLKYFDFARINDGRINPYWPRASILTSISLLVDQNPTKVTPKIVRAQLSTMKNIAPQDIDDHVIDWAAGLIEQAELLRGAHGYDGIWADYLQMVREEIFQNGNQYRTKILAAHNRLCDLLSVNIAPIQVATILNPLQADPLTDVVNIQNHSYVVTSHLRVDSYVHELLHLSLDSYLQVWEERIFQSVNLLDLVYGHMNPLSYAWDHSPTSWYNVFSETLVRVLTVLISDADPESQNFQIEGLVQQGFTYARPIAETLASREDVQPLTHEWLEVCLEACATLANQAKQG